MYCVRVDVYEYGGQGIEDKSRHLSQPSALSFLALHHCINNRPGVLQVSRILLFPPLVIEILKLQVCPIVPSFYVGSMNVCGKHFPTEPSLLALHI